jgi:hypothetical protein
LPHASAKSKKIEREREWLLGIPALQWIMTYTQSYSKPHGMYKYTKKKLFTFIDLKILLNGKIMMLIFTGENTIFCVKKEKGK